MRLLFRGRPASDIDDGPLAEVLGRYAVEALAPDDATLSRMGTAVRAAFVAAMMARNEGLAPEEAPLGGAPRRWGAMSWNRRRAFAAMAVVAMLAFSTVGLATAQSGPGQPFYRLRLSIESVNLPPDGSKSRTEADLDRSEARIVEVGVEAASSNWNGAADAAAAYREVISTIALPTDASSKGSAMQRLDKQLGHLEQLRASSRGPETAEVDGAIAALCRILGIPTPTPIPAPVTSAGPGASNHDGSHETAPPSATARHASEPDHSPGTGTSPNHGESGNSGGDHQGPSSKPNDNDAKTPGPSDPPGESH